MPDDTITHAKELTRVIKRILKVSAILAKLQEREAKLLAALKG